MECRRNAPTSDTALVFEFIFYCYVYCRVTNVSFLLFSTLWGKLNRSQRDIYQSQLPIVLPSIYVLRLEHTNCKKIEDKLRV